jgi:hypothetical protein
MNLHQAAPIAITAFAAALLTACQPAEAPEAREAREPGLEGAWSIVSIRVTGPDSSANTTVQPSVYLFGDTHYSMMRVTGNQPRTLAAADSVTDAEKLAAYDSFVANTGTYEVADSTITIHPIVARSPNFMSGGSDKYHFRVSGDTLWLSNTGADFRTMIGGQLVAPPRASTTMLVLVRQK